MKVKMQVGSDDGWTGDRVTREEEGILHSWRKY